MNWYFLPPFIVSILLLFLAIFVYCKNKKSKLNILLSLECTTSFVWLFSYSMMNIFLHNEKVASFWMRLAYVGVIYIPVLCYHFVVEFLQHKKEKIIVYISYFISTLFVLLHFKTNLFIDGLIRYYWGYYPRAAILHPVFLLFFTIIIGIIIYHTFVAFIKREEVFKDIRKKEQIKYLFLAFFLYSAACADFIANYNIALYPFGYIFAAAFLAIIAYAIVRHQLMDIEMIIKKTLIFAGLFTVVYAVFAFFALLGQAFFERFIVQNRWISMIPSVVVITIMLRPLENLLVTATDKYLFQKKYDYRKLLKAFTSEVLTVLELDKLVNLTRDTLIDIMKIKTCEVVLGPSPQEAELKIPIALRGQAIGTLLLGKKKSDEDYTQEDLDILQPLAKALGIAISNAKLFDELSKARAKMAEKDKMATIGTLAAGMAHEIRNPMTTIRNFADYLPERRKDRDFMDKFDSLIPKEIDRIENIARSLLEFSSSEGDRSDEDFSMKDVMKTVLALLEPQYRFSGIGISEDCRGGCMAHANKGQVQDAVFNMIKYIFAEAPKGSNISINIAEDKEGVSVMIKNTDLIVAEHIIKDVFEPVAGLYKEKRGFGFDLFIAKQLLQKNGAIMAIHSDRDNGSEFRIKFKNVSGRPS